MWLDSNLVCHKYIFHSCGRVGLLPHCTPMHKTVLVRLSVNVYSQIYKKNTSLIICTLITTTSHLWNLEERFMLHSVFMQYQFSPSASSTSSTSKIYPKSVHVSPVSITKFQRRGPDQSYCCLLYGILQKAPNLLPILVSYSQFTK
jgi:hypothetical protein